MSPLVLGIVQWSGWTEWTPCDVTCGVSVERRSRNRECEQFTECSEEETRMCNRIPCVLCELWIMCECGMLGVKSGTGGRTCLDI